MYGHRADLDSALTPAGEPRHDLSLSRERAEEHQGGHMSFCDHCEGQRFDRARVLRALRETRQRLRRAGDLHGSQAVAAAIQATRSLDLPHLEPAADLDDSDVVH